MNRAIRGVLYLAVFVLFSGLAFFAARHWQNLQDDWVRLAPPVDCDFAQGPCRYPLAGGVLTFSVLPPDVPLMKPLELRLVMEGLEADAVAVEIRGLNMDMGLNRTRLLPDAGGGWSGETILPLCSQRRMQWEAAVQLEMQEHVEVPFHFQTRR